MVRRRIGFGQAIKMIDDLVVELKKEQQDQSQSQFSRRGFS
jgi:hypothetical protein